MFSTSKSSASLTSGLLARKGQARPAMRPQGYVNLTPTLEDLGWNDMGDEPVPTPTPAAPQPAGAPAELPKVLAQLEVLKERVETVAPAAPVPALAAIEPAPEARARGWRTAFTLRLDADRHLRLRLASAVRNQSAQQLVTQALDAFLDDVPEVDGLARQLGGKK